MRAVLVFAALIAIASASSLGDYFEEDSLGDNIEDDVNSIIGSVWGGTCVRDANCLQYVSYCSKPDSNPLVGECRVYWYWLCAVAALLLFFVLSCIACICCPCCCLYACCKDIFCCCCRNKGYSPANRG